MRKIDADLLDQELEKIYDDTLDGIVRFGIEKCIDAVRHVPTIDDGWNPIKTEKISEDEKKELAERYDMSPEDFDDCWRYACKMPEDEKECLITTSVWGYVCIDTFHIDEDGTMYFEEHEDEDDVLAWMPLPKPYTKEEQS